MTDTYKTVPTSGDNVACWCGRLRGDQCRVSLPSNCRHCGCPDVEPMYWNDPPECYHCGVYKGLRNPTGAL